MVQAAMKVLQWMMQKPYLKHGCYLKNEVPPITETAEETLPIQV